VDPVDILLSIGPVEIFSRRLNWPLCVLLSSRSAIEQPDNATESGETLLALFKLNKRRFATHKRQN
jgi:hypothetical protein